MLHSYNDISFVVLVRLRLTNVSASRALESQRQGHAARTVVAHIHPYGGVLRHGDSQTAAAAVYPQADIRVSADRDVEGTAVISAR